MLVQQLGFLVIVNILFGLAIPNIDNAAHLGGLVTGLWIGTLWPPTRVETIAAFWQRTREAVARRARVPVFVPILVVFVVVVAVGLGLLLGTPRFEA